MDDKFSVLGLSSFEGVLFTKHWNVQSNSIQSGVYYTNTQNRLMSEANGKDVTIVKKKYKNSMINQNIQVWNDSKLKDKEKLQQNIPLKSCLKMELIKSETDIPVNDKLMNANCDTKIDSKEKTEESIVRNHPKKQVKLTKENSFETSEEIDSSDEANQEILNEEVPPAVLEWVLDTTKDDSQGVSSSEDNPAVRTQLSREASLQSSSSLDSILESRRPDPVEIFLNLGFGGLPGVDTENCRIPKRFLVPSKCKGGDWNEFLRRELIQAQNFECSSLGFRGLSAAVIETRKICNNSGPSYRRPSAIVANIMEKLRERTVPPSHNRSRFSAVAKMVLNEKSVLNKLTPEFQSVLSPDSRKFLQNQGKKSPEVPRRRIIFGQKSFAFAHDGEFVEVESSSSLDEKTTKDSTTSNDADEPPVFPNSEVLLKLRRSSLQKQKKVEEDTEDVDDVFYVVSDKEHSNDTSYNNDTNNNSSSNSSKKAAKIPQRFLSSKNLKALEESNITQALRSEVEKEIMSLSQKIKNISSQDLPCVLQQVKELRTKIDSSQQD